MSSKDYSNTVIYKIICLDQAITHCYVGSTRDFANRKSKHKYACNNTTASHHHFKVYETIRNNGGWDNWDMTEIEKYPCSDGNEATLRERYWFEILNADLNTLYPNRTYKERSETNREHINEHHKEYYQTNKEKIRIKQNETIICSCGSIIRKRDKAKHLKTKKHLAEILSKPNV